VKTAWVSHPFPDERLSLVARTERSIVIKATSRPLRHREFDYVDPRTHLETRQTSFLLLRHQTYRMNFRFRVLRSRSPAIATTPTCP
jgi:hypothetical protein